MTFFLPWYLALLGCQPPETNVDGIEITGYLDNARIVVTTVDSAAQTEVEHRVVGESGAAEVGLDVSVTNLRTGDSDVYASAEDGSFGLSIFALEGDALEIRQGNAPTVSRTSEPLVEFPALASFELMANLPDERVSIRLDFVDPQPSLDFVAHTLHGAIAHLAPLDGDAQVHVGEIESMVGRYVLIYGVSAEHQPTRLLELQVPQP